MILNDSFRITSSKSFINQNGHNQISGHNMLINTLHKVKVLFNIKYVNYYTVIKTLRLHWNERV